MAWQQQQGRGVAALVSVDGFHLIRAQMSVMADAATAHARRGAEFTVDGTAFARLGGSLRAPVAAVVVRAPSVDHAVRDPIEADVAVAPAHRVVVVEGNYVLLDREPWREAAALFDLRWFIHVDFAVARRHIGAEGRCGRVTDVSADGERPVTIMVWRGRTVPCRVRGRKAAGESDRSSGDRSRHRSDRATGRRGGCV